MPFAGLFSSLNKRLDSNILKIHRFKKNGTATYEYIIDSETNQDDFYEIAFIALQNTILSGGKKNIAQIFSEEKDINLTDFLDLTKPQYISNDESSAIQYDLTYVYNYLFLYSGGNNGTNGTITTNYSRDQNFSTLQNPNFTENDWIFAANSDLVNLTIKDISNNYSIPNSLEGLSTTNRDDYLFTFNNKDKYWWNQQIDKQHFILHSTDGSIKYTIQRTCDWNNKKITINISYNYLNTIDYREDNFYNYYVNNNSSIFGTQYDIATKKNILYDLSTNDFYIRKNYHFSVKNDGLYDIFTFLDFTNAAKEDIGSSTTPVSTASVCKTSKKSIKANKSQSLTIYKKDFQLDQHDPNNNYKRNNVLGIGLSIAKDLFHHGDKDISANDIRSQNNYKITKQIGTINSDANDNNTISFYNPSNAAYPIKILFKNIPGDFSIDINNKLNSATNNSPNIISLKIKHENDYYITLSFLSTQSKGIQFLLGYNQKQTTSFFDNPSITLNTSELYSMTFSKVFGDQEISDEKDAEIDIFPYIKEFLPFYHSTQDPINFIIRRTYLWNSETKTKDYSQNTWEFIPLFNCKYIDVWYSHPNKNLDICYFYYKNYNISSPDDANLDIITNINQETANYPISNIHSSVIIGGFIERNSTKRIIVNNSLFLDTNIPQQQVIDFNKHLYFGWAPTSNSNNSFWEPKELKLLQNGIDIIDNSPIVYILQPPWSGSYNDNTGSHFLQYRPDSGWQTFWDNGEYGYRPLLYRKIESNYSLDGSQLTALQKCRGGHIPDSGWILSAENPIGPWYIRGTWQGQKDTNNPDPWNVGFSTTINSTGSASPDLSLNLYADFNYSNATHIGINFIGHDGAYKVTGNAGAIPFANWNNIYVNTTTKPLIDSSGNQLQTTIRQVHGDGPYAAHQNVNKADGSHGTLFHGYIDNFEDNQLVIDNIPELFKNQTYQIRIYHNTDSIGSMGFRVQDENGYDQTYYSTATVGHNNYPIQNKFDPFGGESGYVGSQETSSGQGEQTNYTFFNGLTGNTVTITGKRGTYHDGRARPNGIQITTTTRTISSNISEYHKDPIYHPYNCENLTNEFTWDPSNNGFNSQNPGQGSFYKILYNANESKLYFYDKIHRSVMWKPRENSITQKWNLLHTQDICFNDIDSDELYLKVFMSHGSQRILLNWREALSGTNIDGSNVDDNNISNNELNVAFHSYKANNNNLIYENNYGYNLQNNVLINEFSNEYNLLVNSNKLYNTNMIINSTQNFIEQERSQLIYNWIFSHKDINISNLNEESIYGIVIPGLNLNSLIIRLYQYYLQYQNNTSLHDSSNNFLSRVKNINFLKLDSFPQDYTGFNSLSHLNSNIDNNEIDYESIINSYENIFPITSISLSGNDGVHIINLLNIHENLFKIKLLQNSNIDNHVTSNNFTFLQSSILPKNNVLNHKNIFKYNKLIERLNTKGVINFDSAFLYNYTFNTNLNNWYMNNDVDNNNYESLYDYVNNKIILCYGQSVNSNNETIASIFYSEDDGDNWDLAEFFYDVNDNAIYNKTIEKIRIIKYLINNYVACCEGYINNVKRYDIIFTSNDGKIWSYNGYSSFYDHTNFTINTIESGIVSDNISIYYKDYQETNSFNNYAQNKEIIVIGGYVNPSPAGPNENNNNGSALMYSFNNSTDWYNKRYTFKNCLLSKNDYINSFNQYDNNTDIICKIYEIKFVNNFFIATMWYHRINIDSGNYYIIRSKNGIIWDLYGPLHGYITFSNEISSKSIVTFEDFKIAIYSDSYAYCLVSYNQGISWSLQAINDKINKIINLSGNNLINYYCYKNENYKKNIISLSEHTSTAFSFNPQFDISASSSSLIIKDILNSGANLFAISESANNNQRNSKYRYWGMSNASFGGWFNGWYRFRWATFEDINGNILNDSTYYAPWSGINMASGNFSLTPENYIQNTSNYFANYIVTDDDETSSDMRHISNWLGSNPLFYVDLGVAKEVYKVIHVTRQQHTMTHPIVVASNDLISWDIITIEGPDGTGRFMLQNMNSTNDTIWDRTIIIPAKNLNTNIYWWGGNNPHLSLFWNTSNRDYYYNGEWRPYEYYKNNNVGQTGLMTSNNGYLHMRDQNVGDQNIHIEFEAGTVSYIKIRGEPSSTAYAFWTGSQWEGQTMANGQSSLWRYGMQSNQHLIWTNNFDGWAELTIVPPSNATQLGLLNGDGRKYVSVHIYPIDYSSEANSVSNILKGSGELFFPEKKNEFYNNETYFSGGSNYEFTNDLAYGLQEVYSKRSIYGINSINNMFIDNDSTSDFKYNYNDNSMNITACIGSEVYYCDNNKYNKYDNKIIYKWSDGTTKDIYKLSSIFNTNNIFIINSELNLYKKPKNNNYGYDNIYRISDFSNNTLIKSLSSDGPKLSHMFSHAYSWNNGNTIGKNNDLIWKISSPLNCNNMFYRCFSMNTKFIYPFIIGADATNMFNSCIHYNNGYNYYQKNSSQLDFENMQNANSLFNNCYYLNLNFDKVISPNIKNLEYAFQNCFFLDTDLSKMIKNIKNKKNLNIRGLITNTNLSEENYSKLLFEIVANIPNTKDYKTPSSYSDYYNIASSTTGLNNNINTEGYILSNTTRENLPWSDGTFLSDINNLSEVWNIGSTLNYKLIQFIKDTKYNSSNSEKIKIYHLGIYGYNDVFFADPLYEMLYHTTVQRESKQNLDDLAKVYYPARTTFIHAYIFHNAYESDTISRNINSGFGNEQGYGISDNGIIGYYNANKDLGDNIYGLNNIDLNTYINEENYSEYNSNITIEAYLGRQDLININTAHNIDNAKDCFWNFSNNKHLLKQVSISDINTITNTIDFTNIYELTNYNNDYITLTLDNHLYLDSEVILKWNSVISFIDITWFDNLYYEYMENGILNKEKKIKSENTAYLLYSDDGYNWYSYSDNIHGDFYSKYVNNNFKNTDETCPRRFLVPYHARYAKFTSLYSIPVKKIQLKKLMHIETIQRFASKYRNASNSIKYTHNFLRNGPRPKWSAAKFLQDNSSDNRMIQDNITSLGGYSYIKLWDHYENYRNSWEISTNKHKYLVLNWNGTPTRMSLIYKHHTYDRSFIRWAFSDDGERWYSNHDYYTNQNSYLHNNENINSTTLNNISLPPRANFIMLTTNSSKLFALKSVIFRGLITKNDINIYMCNANLKEAYFLKSFGFNFTSYNRIGKIDSNTIETFTPFDNYIDDNNTIGNNRQPNGIWSLKQISNKKTTSGSYIVKKLDLNNDDFMEDVDNVYFESKAYINLSNFECPFLNEPDEDYIDPSNKTKGLVYIIEFSSHIAPNSTSSNYKIDRILIETYGSFVISLAISSDGNTWYDDYFLTMADQQIQTFNVPYSNSTIVNSNIWHSENKFVPKYLMLCCNTTSPYHRIKYLIPRLSADSTTHNRYDAQFSKAYTDNSSIFN